MNHLFFLIQFKSHVSPGSSVIKGDQEIETIRVPVQSPKPPHYLSMATYPIVHPHRILSYLFNDCGLQISSSEVEEFWTHSRGVQEPWAIHSSATSEHIPLGVHGDSARLWTQYRFEKITAIWMNIILFRPASARHSRFLLFSCPTNSMVKNRTLNRVWRRLSWSFNAAFTGMNPTCGEGGRALSGGDLTRSGTPITNSKRKFSLCELRGDWEWHVQIWRPCASWVSNNICFKCPCRAKGEASNLYHCIEPTCTWIQEEYNLEEFISQRLKDRHLCDLGVATYHIPY